MEVTNTIRIAIFLSGQGSNANSIMRYFKNSDRIIVPLIITNNKKWMSPMEGINIQYIDSNIDLADKKLLETLKKHQINYIILAGFIWKIPISLIKEYPDKIINIHPSLLPNYGGKGMYGLYVHKAVIKNKEKRSGFTIHLVNEEYDKGDIIYQHTIDILPSDTPEILQEKIKVSENKYYPEVIENYLLPKNHYN